MIHCNFYPLQHFMGIAQEMGQQGLLIPRGKKDNYQSLPIKCTEGGSRCNEMVISTGVMAQQLRVHTALTEDNSIPKTHIRLHSLLWFHSYNLMSSSGLYWYCADMYKPKLEQEHTYKVKQYPKRCETH